MNRPCGIKALHFKNKVMEVDGTTCLPFSTSIMISGSLSLAVSSLSPRGGRGRCRSASKGLRPIFQSKHYISRDDHFLNIILYMYTVYYCMVYAVYIYIYIYCNHCRCAQASEISINTYVIKII